MWLERPYPVVSKRDFNVDTQTRRPWTTGDEEKTGFRDLSKAPAAYMHYKKGSEEWSRHHGQYDTSRTEERSTTSPPQLSLHMPRGSIHISTTAATQDVEIAELIRRLSEVTTAVIREHVTSMSSTQHMQRYASSAVPTMGHHDNLWSTIVQINCSELKTPLATSIKYEGKPYVDKNDDTFSPSVLLFLGHHPPDYYPGRMTQYATRTFFPAHILVPPS
ncbi:hypothetical protein DL98DRAFT_596653 [Cadophora sp. DSE1049]|nr:hypothetical protein DL98DRAFT_596653 [Cadophora sp. DSE1049]